MSGRRVMIVEDEVMVQMHLAGIVESLGHELVGTAEDTEAALSLADRERPELVLMDIHLAGGSDGVETAQELSRRLECAVIFITAYADEETIRRTQEIGAGGYLVKPFTDAQVRAAIATAFASHAKLQHEREQARSLSGVLSHIGGALFLIDHKDEITFANQSAADLVGWPVYKVFGRSIFAVLGVEGDALRETLLRAQVQGRPCTVELLVNDVSEQARRVLVSVESLPAEDGSLQGSVLSLSAVDGEPFSGIDAPRRESAQRVQRPFGAGTRLLVYSHDTYGLGHLRRCLAIIRRLCAEFNDLSVLLVTGSPMAHRYAMPAGADYVKLPAIQKTGVEQYEARSLGISAPDIHTLRSNLILHTARDYKPNVLLVDHSPTGGGGELLPTLNWLKDEGQCTGILGMRDVIDDPSRVRDLWRAEDIYSVIRDNYQHILVYGSVDFLDKVDEYELPETVRSRVHHVNYICSAELDDPVENPQAEDTPMIFVTIGGGDGGSDAVLLPFLEMMRSFKDRLGFRAEIVTGPLIGADRQARLELEAQDLPVTLHSFLPSTRHLLERAAITVSTAGYNTCTDVLSFAQRSILIPRAMYRMEQTIRAQRFEELGLCTLLRAENLTPQILFDTIQRVRAQKGLAELRARGLPLNGTDRVAQFCSELSVSVAPS